MLYPNWENYLSQCSDAFTEIGEKKNWEDHKTTCGTKVKAMSRPMKREFQFDEHMCERRDFGLVSLTALCHRSVSIIWNVALNSCSYELVLSIFFRIPNALHVKFHLFLKTISDILIQLLFGFYVYTNWCRFFMILNILKFLLKFFLF